MTTEADLLPLPSGNVAHLIAAQAAEIEALRAEVERLAEALECMIIGACAVAVPHNGERAVLQDAVNIARAALAAYRKGGKQ